MSRVRFTDKEKAAIIALHTKQGLSTNEIAKLLGKKKNSILVFLRNMGLLRKNTGYDTESRVEAYFKRHKIDYIRQRGDAPYDFLVDGVKIDVKGAHRSTDNLYYFELQHVGSKRKTAMDIDLLFLVFLDEPSEPIFALPFHTVSGVRRLIRIRDPFTSKYDLDYYGLLGI